jgi:hypothetical protein
VLCHDSITERFDSRGFEIVSLDAGVQTFAFTFD